MGEAADEGAGGMKPLEFASAAELRAHYKLVRRRLKVDAEEPSRPAPLPASAVRPEPARRHPLEAWDLPPWPWEAGAPAQGPDIPRIAALVAVRYRVPLAELCAAGYIRRKFSHPRHIAYYLCRELSRHSWAAIGQHFGGRHVTSVQHAVERVAARAARDPSFAAELSALLAACATAFPSSPVFRPLPVPSAPPTR
jgi:hypothetical protein